MNQTVLVTGGSGGIGAATVRLFAQQGYNVAIGYHRGKTRAEQLAAELCAEGMQAVAFGADLADRTAAFALVEKVQSTFGHLDVLINNAGISQVGLFSDLSEADWRNICGTNLDAAIYTAQAASREMVSRQRGCILNVASMWGEVGASCEVAYSVTKAGLIGLTRALAKELGPSGIRVNCVSPGMIDTAMNTHFSAEDVAAIAEETPLCRIGKPEEVAAALLYLAGEGASFITGQVLGCNGGLVI